MFILDYIVKSHEFSGVQTH